MITCRTDQHRPARERARASSRGEGGDSQLVRLFLSVSALGVSPPPSSSSSTDKSGRFSIGLVSYSRLTCFFRSGW